MKRLLLALLAAWLATAVPFEAAHAGQPTKAAVVLAAKADGYPGATVALDFIGARCAGQPRCFKAGGVLAPNFASLPGVTVTRATGGYAEDQTGALTWFNSGQARITNKGLLIEETRTNLLTWSQDYTNAAWTKSSVTTTTGQVAPDGSLTATILTGSGTFPYVEHSTITYTAAAYTFSFYVKKGGSGTIGLAFTNAGSADEAAFDIAAGSAGTKGANVSSSGVIDAGSWWRIWAVSTRTAAGGTPRIFAGYSANATPTVWGAQVELGAFVSSYTPATSASATRAADSILVNGWPAARGTLLEQTYIGLKPPSGSTGSALFDANSTADSSNRHQAVIRNTSNNFTMNTLIAGSRVFATADIGYANYAPDRAGYSWSASGGNFAANGQSIETTATDLSGLNPSSFYIGSQAGNSFFLNGYVQLLLLYSTPQSMALLQGWTGGVDESSLNLNFAGGSYRAVVNGNVVRSTSLSGFATAAGYTLTATRAASAYASDSSGNLISFGSNVPRITDLGLLVEEARTNLLLQSQTFTNAAWNANQGTVTGAATTAPDGTSTAALYTEDLTSSTLHGPSQLSVSLAGTTTYSVSAYAKYAGRQYLRIAVADAGAGPAGSVYFNIQTCAVGSNSFAVGTFVSASAVSVANGFCKLTMTFTTVGATTTEQVRLVGAPADGTASYTGSGASAFYIWQADLQAGAFMTSPIVTTSATATRPKDVITFTGLSIARPYTVGYEATFKNPGGGDQVNFNTLADGVGFYANGLPSSPISLVREGGVNTAILSATDNIPVDQVVRQVARLAVNDANSASDGIIGTADTATSPPATITQIGFGTSVYGLNGTPAGGYLKQLRIYPYAANDNELQYRSAGNW